MTKWICHTMHLNWQLNFHFHASFLVWHLDFLVCFGIPRTTVVKPLSLFIWRFWNSPSSTSLLFFKGWGVPFSHKRGEGTVSQPAHCCSFTENKWRKYSFMLTNVRLILDVVIRAFYGSRFYSSHVKHMAWLSECVLIKWFMVSYSTSNSHQRVFIRHCVWRVKM